jgi:hypothetical protein
MVYDTMKRNTQYSICFSAMKEYILTRLLELKIITTLYMMRKQVRY